ncbi:tetratricopeptide repeat protein, partial [bacterium]|nr:tetratricopeptide repeat protein [bacterium]
LEQHSDKLGHIGHVADLLGYTYHHEEAATLRTHLLEQQRGQTSPFDLANTLNAKGVSLKNSGDLEGAMKAYKEAETIFRNLGERGSLVTVLGNQGNVLRRQEKLDQALSVLKDAVQTSRELKNQYGLLSCLNAISLVYLDLEEYKKALTCLKEQEILCRETGERMGLAAALGNQVSVLEKLWEAKPGELLALLRQEAEIYRELGIHPKLEESLIRQAKLLKRQARSLYKQSIIQKEKKDQEKVIAIYSEEEKIWNELNNIEGLAIAQSKRAFVMALLGQNEARSVVEHAYALAVSNSLTNAARDIKKTMDLVCSTLDQ